MGNRRTEKERMTKHATLGPDAPLDVERLIESRLLIQANSGAGKSWALRRLLEQTYSHVPQIVIDVEGEFHTLREKFDYVLAGQKGGDCPADTKSAAMLARRLLELNVSAIVDIYELGVQRAKFVKLFLDSLVNAPRELWHPTLVVIDEAHMFAPEAGQAESADSVKDLMTRGRKRGFCGVLATQRISKLHKDAAAECNNKLIGRSSLDIDMKRAGAELGFTNREDLQKLRTLAPGTFYAFGPALSDEVRLVTIGAVQTTHPKAGERASAPTPPREKVRKVLAQLADLPREAEEEARTVGEWKAKAKQLAAELRDAKKGAPVAQKVVDHIIEKPVVSKAMVTALERSLDHGGKTTVQAATLADRAGTMMAKAAEMMAASALRFEAEVTKLRSSLAAATSATVGNSSGNRSVRTGVTSDAKSARRVPDGRPALTHRDSTQPTARAATPPGGTALPVGEAATLRALIQYTAGLERRQLTVITGYKRSTRDAYIARLREKGLVAVAGDRVQVTREGMAAMPDAEPLPTGTALQDHWLKRLPSGEGTILAKLLEVNGEEYGREDLSEATGFKRSTRDAYLSRLAAKELVIDLGRGFVKASPTLFEVSP